MTIEVTTGSEDRPVIGGTLVWYYAICHREAWLMLHAISPDENDPNVAYGRFLQDRAYKRKRKEFKIDGSKLDIVTRSGKEILVVEVKKSSRAMESARLQLAHYLLELEERGIHAHGELRFPEERRREVVVLDDTLRAEIQMIREHLQRLAAEPVPPAPVRNAWCSKCAYAELCWS
jgi:CRISPR-associated exonuclease Cas4